LASSDRLARRKTALLVLAVKPARRKGCDAASRQVQIGEADVVNVQGRFVWYELMTTDMVAAAAFYTSVVRWGTRDASMPGMAYTLFTAAETSVSGLMILPEDAKKTGAGPRWMGYVGVSDVDATAGRITQLGGTVQVPPTDIPGISRFSIVADPQMATLALIKWLRPRQELPAAPNAPGRVGWHELLTADCDKALSFYREVFGWLKGIADVGARGTYQLFSVGGQTAGAIVTKPATVPGAIWLYYFNVGDIDAAANRVKSSGGEILNGPTEVPDGSWIVQCIDPEGAIFALVGKRSSNAAGFLERVAALD
jgi:predicted enzyme related to lactoylglutathione lyase